VAYIRSSLLGIFRKRLHAASELARRGSFQQCRAQNSFSVSSGPICWIVGSENYLSGNPTYQAQEGRAIKLVYASGIERPDTAMNMRSRANIPLR